MDKIKETCGNCEHNNDSGQEYCGSCDGHTSNWVKARWILQETIDILQAENKKLKKQQLTEDEIEKVILDNKEIFIFEDSGMGEGIDYSKLAKAIIKAREAKIKEIDK